MQTDDRTVARGHVPARSSAPIDDDVERSVRVTTSSLVAATHSPCPEPPPVHPASDDPPDRCRSGQYRGPPDRATRGLERLDREGREDSDAAERAVMMRHRVLTGPRYPDRRPARARSRDPRHVCTRDCGTARGTTGSPPSCLESCSCVIALGAVRSVLVLGGGSEIARRPFVTWFGGPRDQHGPHGARAQRLGRGRRGAPRSGSDHGGHRSVRRTRPGEPHAHDRRRVRSGRRRRRGVLAFDVLGDPAASGRPGLGGPGHHGRLRRRDVSGPSGRETPARAGPRHARRPLVGRRRAGQQVETSSTALPRPNSTLQPGLGEHHRRQRHHRVHRPAQLRPHSESTARMEPLRCRPRPTSSPRPS